MLLFLLKLLIYKIPRGTRFYILFCSSDLVIFYEDLAKSIRNIQNPSYFEYNPDKIPPDIEFAKDHAVLEK